MTTLTEFLLARIADDEAWVLTGDCGCADVKRPDCPDRVLAECEAKRRIVEHHAPIADEFVLCAICAEVGLDAQVWPCLTLQLLALPYADHPDYREEWKP